ncbi:uncharacterized protein LOC124692068 isoform X2 [Lolium rigidum]|uniref:uncharacterized protein LOC124692068 isoform X2 n=1 Tax=Lolium rigidum TaxID=89674 RepID=UPI001F5C1F47|nr:uncharacterized protein LOC124692068 isoform X2 [Lolium rigidum]
MAWCPTKRHSQVQSYGTSSIVYRWEKKLRGVKDPPESSLVRSGYLHFRQSGACSAHRAILSVSSDSKTPRPITGCSSSEDTHHRYLQPKPMSAPSRMVGDGASNPVWPLHRRMYGCVRGSTLPSCLIWRMGCRKN